MAGVLAIADSDVWNTLDVDTGCSGSSGGGIGNAGKIGAAAAVCPGETPEAAPSPNGNCPKAGNGPVCSDDCAAPAPGVENG